MKNIWITLFIFIITFVYSQDLGKNKIKNEEIKLYRNERANRFSVTK